MNATKSRRNRPLVWIVGGLLLAVAGCIAIPLGDPEKSKIDDKLVGIWMSNVQGDESQTMYTVTAYDSRTYFVSDFEFKKDKDTVTATGRMDWKMWLTDVGGQRFATLQMITPQLLLDPKSKDNDEKYAIVKLMLDGDKMTVQAVNDDFIKSANVQNSQALEDFIAKNLSNSQLFNNDSEVETRVKDDQKDAASAVLSAFGQGK